jgi:hypothetical protein
MNAGYLNELAATGPCKPRFGPPVLAIAARRFEKARHRVIPHTSRYISSLASIVNLDGLEHCIPQFALLWGNHLLAPR